MRDRDVLTRTTIARHLARGAIGFGLIGSALALAGSIGVAALALVPLGMVALRGCPACWIARMVEIVSAGRLARDCASCVPPGTMTGEVHRLDLRDSAVRHAQGRN